MEQLETAKDAIFAYDRWLGRIDELAQRFQSAEPFPHIVLDDFLAPDAANRCLSEFPQLASNDWINYTHVNERKFGQSKRSELSGMLAETIDEFNSPQFLQFIERLSGIRDLIADPALMGGGLHQSERGGYLNVHADFTGHQHHPTWKRRINLLLYLNKDWPETYGGYLELWDRKMQQCVHRIAPIFNRCVIFNTDTDSFHGHPDPMMCPPGVTRKSMALYYFTDEQQPFLVRSTEYRARPGEGFKAFPIWLDKWVLRGYDAVKRRLHLNDDFASRVLKVASGNFGKSGRRKRNDKHEHI